MSFRIKGLSKPYQMSKKDILDIIDKMVSGGEVEFEGNLIQINLNISQEDISKVRLKVMQKLENQRDLA